MATMKFNVPDGTNQDPSEVYEGQDKIEEIAEAGPRSSFRRNLAWKS